MQSNKSALHFNYEDFDKQIIAVISDIHANDIAFKVAVDQIRQREVLNIIFLGDLLSFGCATMQVIERLQNLQKEYNVHIIMGNHDEFYFELQAGRKLESLKLPEFLLESIAFNLSQLNINLEAFFEWHSEITIGKILFSHANPFGDWKYITTDEDFVRASRELCKRGFEIGIFGHNHIPKIRLMNKLEGTILKNNYQTTLPIAETLETIIVTTGSAGMPRSHHPDQMQQPALLFLHFEKAKLDIQLEKINYSEEAQKLTIENSTLSPATKNKLKNMYPQSNSL